MASLPLLRYDENRRAHRFARTVATYALSVSLFLLMWELTALYANLSLLPSPVETLEALVKLWTQGDLMTGLSLGDYVRSSLATFVKGFLLALAVTVPLGLLVGYFRFLRELTNPLIEMMRPVAPIVWAPFFLVMFGYQVGPMLVVFVGVFFPMVTNVMFGVMKVEPEWLDAAKTLGASDTQVFLKVIVPASLPYVMNGVRIGLGIGWMCIVAAEFYASPVGGIGFLLTQYADMGYWSGVFAAVFVIGVLGILTVGTAGRLHALLSRRMGMEAESGPRR